MLDLADIETRLARGDSVPADVKALIGEVVRLRAALQFYASRLNWDDIEGVVLGQDDAGLPKHGWDVAEVVLEK